MPAIDLTSHITTGTLWPTDHLHDEQGPYRPVGRCLASGAVENGVLRLTVPDDFRGPAVLRLFHADGLELYREPVTASGGDVLTWGDTTRNEESEPVLIETVGDAVVFALDDGERLEFDRVELLSALGSAIAGDMGRLRAA